MKSPINSIPLVYILAVVTNIGFCYFVYVQINNIDAVSSQWEINTEQSLTKATRLAELERDLGYVGFIHHFKNKCLIIKLDRTTGPSLQPMGVMKMNVLRTYSRNAKPLS